MTGTRETVFNDDDYYTGPTISADLIRGAEEVLGLSLPRSYVEVLRERNGGTPRKRCFFTKFRTSWAPDHFEVSGILGIGGKRGIDSVGLGSTDLIIEWEYPNIGIVFCDTPSAGHDTVMLDYRACGGTGEPSVVYVDEDRVPRKIAESFQDFLNRLSECPE